MPRGPLPPADVLWLSGRGSTADPTPTWDTLGLLSTTAGEQWGAQNWLLSGSSTDSVGAMPQLQLERASVLACQERELGIAQPHPYTVPSPQQEFSA